MGADEFRAMKQSAFLINTARQVAVDELTANVAAFLNGEERCRVV
jgi:phosphoglycerate dehydrogenase-like enzyme